MAASINIIHVNDYVQIDGKKKGRVTSAVKPLGTYTMYNIRSFDGEISFSPKVMATQDQSKASQNQNYATFFVPISSN